MNIDLSDYSSDEGDTSSCSEEERVQEHIGEVEDCCPPLRVPPPSPVLPRREHKSSNKETVVERSPPAPRRILQVHRTTIDLATTDPGSDLCEPPTELESGDDSLSWRQSNKKSKNDSPVRVPKCSEKSSMPPELIVTPAQVYEIQMAAELNDKLAVKEEFTSIRTQSINLTAELQPVDKLRTHAWHHLRCPPLTRFQNRSVAELSSDLQVKVGSSLRQKLWTSIPCNCHSSSPDTHWSKGALANSHEALLRSCSQKLSMLQHNYTQTQAKGEKFRKKLSRLRKYAAHTRHNSDSETSPAEEADTETSENQTHYRKKQKYRLSQTRTTSLKQEESSSNKIDHTKVDVRKPSIGASTGNKHQQRQKPTSLKWKFRKGGLVATAVSTSASKVNQPDSASDTETNDKQKNSGKKKKKRKSSTAKKSKRVSSATKHSPIKSVKSNVNP